MTFQVEHQKKRVSVQCQDVVAEINTPQAECHIFALFVRTLSFSATHF